MFHHHKKSNHTPAHFNNTDHQLTLETSVTVAGIAVELHLPRLGCCLHPLHHLGWGGLHPRMLHAGHCMLHALHHVQRILQEGARFLRLIPVLVPHLISARK